MSGDGPAHDLSIVMKFALHTLAGVVLFAVIGAAAALLAHYTNMLAQLKISPLVIEGMHAAEYFLFAVDMLCFAVYVSREAFMLIAAMVRPGGGPTDLPR